MPYDWKCVRCWFSYCQSEILWWLLLVFFLVWGWGCFFWKWLDMYPSCTRQQLLFSHECYSRWGAGKTQYPRKRGKEKSMGQMNSSSRVDHCRLYIEYLGFIWLKGVILKRQVKNFLQHLDIKTGQDFFLLIMTRMF